MAAPQSVLLEKLTLQAVFWKPKGAAAIVNGETVKLLDEVTIRLLTTNVAVRCLEVGRDYVKVRRLPDGGDEVLRLPQKAQ